MGTPATLPLSIIADVTVLVSPQAPAQPTFNQGLIVGSSAVIPTSERVRKYSSGTLSQMLTDGFTTSSPEYLAAQLYFSQSPAPDYVWIGRQDLTSSETLLAAVEACRAKSGDWWAVMACGAAKADHEAIAGFIETASPASMYFYATADADALSGAGGNVFSALKALSYKRSIGIYSTTQSASAPKNIYAAAALMGVAMGLNTGLANSYFTLKFKTLTGIVTEPLTLSQLTTIEDNNGNVYLNYGNAYNIFEQGVVADGQFLDEMLNLDMLASDMQYNVMNLLAQNPSIPMTDAGETQLIHAVNEACEAAKLRGFIATGVWLGRKLLNLNPGDTVPNGYLSQAESFSKQAGSDRQARKAMPIYTAIVEAGSMHSVAIAVMVQR